MPVCLGITCLCLPLLPRITCAFTEERDTSKDSQKEKLMTCWCSSDGAGTATPSLCSVRIDVAVLCGSRVVKQNLCFTEK